MALSRPIRGASQTVRSSAAEASLDGCLPDRTRRWCRCVVIGPDVRDHDLDRKDLLQRNDVRSSEDDLRATEPEVRNTTLCRLVPDPPFGGPNGIRHLPRGECDQVFQSVNPCVSSASHSVLPLDSRLCRRRARHICLRFSTTCVNAVNALHAPLPTPIPGATSVTCVASGTSSRSGDMGPPLGQQLEGDGPLRANNGHTRNRYFSRTGTDRSRLTDCACLQIHDCGPGGHSRPAERIGMKPPNVADRHQARPATAPTS